MAALIIRSLNYIVINPYRVHQVSRYPSKIGFLFEKEGAVEPGSVLERVLGGHELGAADKEN